jgi:hypothetical protein
MAFRAGPVYGGVRRIKSRPDPGGFACAPARRLSSSITVVDAKRIGIGSIRDRRPARRRRRLETRFFLQCSKRRQTDEGA